MIQELLEKYGVFVLVLAYLIINVYLRNLKVLVLLLVTFVAFYQTVTNKTYALVIVYLVSISFSVSKTSTFLKTLKVFQRYQLIHRVERNIERKVERT